MLRLAVTLFVSPNPRVAVSWPESLLSLVGVVWIFGGRTQTKANCCGNKLLVNVSRL